MKATIKITGNQVEKYTLVVYLPKAFTEQFAAHLEIEVAGEILTATWGYGDDPVVRSQTLEFVTYAEIDEGLANIRADIAHAVRFLKTVVETDREIEIDVGE